jgi:hypothetical protein
VLQRDFERRGFKKHAHAIGTPPHCKTSIVSVIVGPALLLQSHDPDTPAVNETEMSGIISLHHGCWMAAGRQNSLCLYKPANSGRQIKYRLPEATLVHTVIKNPHGNG